MNRDHVIHRQVLEVECTSEEIARRAGLKLRSILGEVRPQLDQICTAAVTGDDTRVRIDRIEVNMGQLAPDRIREDFAEVFCWVFEREVRDSLKRIPKEGTEPNQFP